MCENKDDFYNGACDILGCTEEAEFEDEMQNKYCASCMETAINGGEMMPEEFETIV